MIDKHFAISFNLRDPMTLRLLLVSDNKFRILKNGAIAAVLNAMKSFSNDEHLQANGLKTLCNLLESGKLVSVNMSAALLGTNS